MKAANYVQTVTGSFGRVKISGDSAALRRELANRFASDINLVQIVHGPYISASLGGDAYADVLRLAEILVLLIHAAEGKADWHDATVR